MQGQADTKEKKMFLKIGLIIFAAELIIIFGLLIILKFRAGYLPRSRGGYQPKGHFTGIRKLPKGGTGQSFHGQLPSISDDAVPPMPKVKTPKVEIIELTGE